MKRASPSWKGSIRKVQTEIPKINEIISSFCSSGAMREQISKQKNPIPVRPTII